MRVFVVDDHPIYRRGVVQSLIALDDVEAVAEAASVAEATGNPELAEADVALVDTSLSGGRELIRSLHDQHVPVVACSPSTDEADVLEAVQAGAVGYLGKDSLTPASLAAAVRGAEVGAGVMAPEVLGTLLRGITRVSREVLEPQGIRLSRLNSRELDVLRLVAAGYPTREVAEQLCYSERTIKNVMHDVVTKLHARSRSQAVAFAVRDGLI
jgi:DNA-binding NarL/FixJ family response regulator